MMYDQHTQSVIDQLLQENGLSATTRLFRESLLSTLQPTEEDGVFRLAANAAPVDTVVDAYGEGHIVEAERVGAGLAFAESASPNWQETMEMHTLRLEPGAPLDPHVEVEMTLGDVLAQGGRVYPIKSVVVERAWYCTLPAGSVLVRMVR